MFCFMPGVFNSFNQIRLIISGTTDSRWYFGGLDDGYIPEIYAIEHSQRYIAQQACLNNRDAGVGQANSKVIGGASNKLLATDWTKFKEFKPSAIFQDFVNYGTDIYQNNIAYDNCMRSAGLISN